MRDGGVRELLGRYTTGVIVGNETPEIIHELYLPFTAQQLRPHFLADVEKRIEYFRKSARNYQLFLEAYPNRDGLSLKKAKGPCQIEKDERFWTATALKSLTEAPHARLALVKLLSKTFGPEPPITGLPTWNSCLDGQLHLVLEASMPSPRSYVAWLRSHLDGRHFIPYVGRAAVRAGTRTLEGPTYVDGVILNSTNGFALLIEAKVLSDISAVVSFDVFRNQLARNVDVMLEPQALRSGLLSTRRPDRSLLAVLSPQCFQKRSKSRLYGWLLDEYRRSADAIARDLPHRTILDLSAIPTRLGWLTFEDIEAEVPGACPWLPRAA